MKKQAPENVKLSPVEQIKRASDYLRGSIAEELVDGQDAFGKESIQVLKHHGTYQQDDRDARGKKDGSSGKSSKHYMFMVRTKIPGGKLTSDQLSAELDLADEVANGTLRVTTRQGFQLHGVLKRNLKQTIHRINQVQLSTLAACGDVERNVMCCPAPHHGDPVHQQMQQLADRLAEHLCPRTRAYHELWLTDPETGERELVGGRKNGEPVEPIYGPTYLPRKFKTAIGLAGDNCVDLYANDIGLLAVCRDFNIIGYNVLVGGGMGVTPSAKKTFPALAKPLCFARPEEVIDVVTAIVKVQRDFGNRQDRKVARMKYLIANWGLDAFKDKVEQYYGQPLAEPLEDDVWGFDDHLGWREQGDGRWYYGLNIENGRIKDAGNMRLKTALREICGSLKPGFRLTAHQSILFTDIPDRQKAALEDILRGHGVPLSEEVSAVRRWSMACPAMPTCGLAITESERFLPQVIDELERELARLGLGSEVFTIRMTGCPNGCARPYNSDIGLVGKAKGKYTVFLGGRLLGNRLNFVYQDLVAADQIVDCLKPVLLHFKQFRQAGETLGDFCARLGADQLRNWSQQHAGVPAHE